MDNEAQPAIEPGILTATSPGSVPTVASPGEVDSPAKAEPAPEVVKTPRQDIKATTDRLDTRRFNIQVEIGQFSREGWKRYAPDTEYQVTGGFKIRMHHEFGLQVSAPGSRSWVPFDDITSKLDHQQVIEIANKLADIAELAFVKLFEAQSEAAQKRISAARQKMRF